MCTVVVVRMFITVTFEFHPLPGQECSVDMNGPLKRGMDGYRLWLHVGG